MAQFALTLLSATKENTMLITTTLLQKQCECMAHLVSNSPTMSDFEDLGSIFVWKDKTEPKCPDNFEMNVYYHLVWSINAKTQYAFSKTYFGETVG